MKSAWVLVALAACSRGETDRERDCAQLRAILEPAPGAVLVRSNVDRLDWLACRLLTLDCPFVVRHPPELRDELRRLAARAAAMAERMEP